MGRPAEIDEGQAVRLSPPSVDRLQTLVASLDASGGWLELDQVIDGLWDRIDWDALDRS